MTNIYFKSTSILSEKEKKAFSFTFSPTINMIYGENDTGKSTLIKSLYYSLGGDVRLDKNWVNNDFITKTTISINGEDYVFIRNKKKISVFLESDKSKPLVSSSSRSDIAEFISRIFDFRLTLAHKKTGLSAISYPACLYLPYYIDQDTGWYQVLGSFSGLTMYEDWQKHTLQFHSGIRPPEFYDLLSQIKGLNVEVDDLTATLKAIESAKERFEKSFGRVLFDVNLDYYQELISKFVEKCQKLNDEETTYRVELFELLSLRDEISKELEEYNEELKKLEHDALSGATEISDKYHIFESREILLETLPNLLDEKEELNKKISRTRKKLDNSQKLSSELNRMLTEVKGELSLKEIIKSEASKEVETTFKEQADELLLKIGQLTTQKNDLESQKSEYTNPARAKDVNTYFKEHLEKAQTYLGIQNPVVKGLLQYSKITKSETGSRNPRGIFSYHYALLQTMKAFSKLPMLPIVIDSPKQQDMDKSHTKKVLNLCLNDLSDGNQLIIGSVALEENMRGYHDLRLQETYSLLNEELYEEVSQDLLSFYSNV